MRHFVDGTRHARWRRLLSGTLALLMAVALMTGFSGVARAASSEQLDSLKEQASSLEGQDASLQAQLDELQGQANSKLDEKALLEQQISVVSAQIANTEALIAEYDVQIADKQVELEQAQAEEAEYYALFCERVRDMEEQGSVSYWSILFGSSDFTDLLDRIVFVGDVMDYDQQMVENLEAARQAVADAKAGLETSQAEQQDAKAALESQEAELAKDEAAVDAAIAEINSQADLYEGQLAELRAQAADLDAQIAEAQKAYDDQVAAEKAAAEKAEAEKQETQTQTPSNSASSNSSSSNTSSSGSSASGSGRISMVWPCGSTRITSNFGYRDSPTAGASSYHQGIDIGASTGTGIYAAASGTVTEAGYSSSRGNYVVISHGSGVSTVYMHCSALYVSAGDSVTQGETIAAVGSTGISTGPHLHFGVIEDGVYVNPRNYV